MSGATASEAPDERAVAAGVDLEGKTRANGSGHAGATAPKLVLLDRDGVVVVNRRTSVKRPEDLALLPGAAAAIRRLREAGCRVALCTNQPEVGRGTMSRDALDAVHGALQARLEEEGAALDAVFASTNARRDRWRKPRGDLLRAALDTFGAHAAETPFVGDQANDLRAAFHAGCRRVLVLTGLGRWTHRRKLPVYVDPVTVASDLGHVADLLLRDCVPRPAASSTMEPAGTAPGEAMPMVDHPSCVGNTGAAPEPAAG